jgi:hypothetical protein
VIAPVVIDGDQVETGPFDFLQDVLPYFRHRETSGVEFAVEGEDPVAVYDEPVVISVDG